MATETGTGTTAPETNGHAAANGSAAQIEVTNPADGSVAGHIPIQTPTEVAEVAQRLRAAQPAWEALGPKGRAKYLYEWLNWIFDHDEEIYKVIQSETGKSWGDASIETLVASEVINYYGKHGEEFLRDQSRRPHGPASLTKKLEIYYRPYQLVGLITPWNYPFAMGFFDAPGALMAGAAVLSKPSEVTPLSWAMAVRGWKEIGAPPVFDMVNGDGSTGSAVVDEVDFVMFTGSTKTGKRIAVQAAERLVPVSLELGGKDAMVILDDADIDRAVGGAIWGAFFNSGQSCISVERCYVQEGVYDQFVSKLKAETEKLRVGQDAPGAYETDYGAMANEAQVEIVERHVKDAIDKGAKALTGGKRRTDGLFYPPTILVDVDHSMSCMKEETFGPTIPVMKVKDEEEAIRLANDSPYGLAGSVWTSSPERARRVGRRIETGSMSINNAMTSVFQFPVPFGGWKDSGVGSRFGGPGGVLKYCRPQAFVSERVNIKSEPHWYPYKKTPAKLQGRAVKLLGAHGWRNRLGLKKKS